MRKTICNLTVAVVFIATTLPMFESDAAPQEPDKLSALMSPNRLDISKSSSFRRIDTATCICDGIPFQASCPGNQKVTCKCGPPGYSCSK
jgi:hypothetical protein